MRPSRYPITMMATRTTVPHDSASMLAIRCERLQHHDPFFASIGSTK